MFGNGSKQLFSPDSPEVVSNFFDTIVLFQFRHLERKIDWACIDVGIDVSFHGRARCGRFQYLVQRNSRATFQDMCGVDVRIQPIPVREQDGVVFYLAQDALPLFDSPFRISWVDFFILDEGRCALCDSQT